MVLMAAVVIACTLSARQELEPKVTWFFNAGQCEVCLRQHLELMTAYSRDTDEVLVITQQLHRDREAIEGLKGELKRRFPMLTVTVTDDDGYRGVGWSFHDPVTAEKVSYTSESGTYNRWRSEALLATLRDQNKDQSR